MHVDAHERRWIIASAVMLAIFAVAIILSALSLGIRLPGREPRSLAAAAAGFDPNEGWVRQLGPQRYEVNLYAQAFFFDPGTIEIPAGSTVTFNLHSRDVLHGWKVIGTNLSMMAIPNQVGRVTYTFDTPGEYTMVCNEFCGLGHHVMAGKIIVTP